MNFQRVKDINEATHFLYKRDFLNDGVKVPFKIVKERMYYDKDGVLLDIFGWDKQPKVIFYKELKNER